MTLSWVIFEYLEDLSVLSICIPNYLLVPLEDNCKEQHFLKIVLCGGSPYRGLSLLGPWGKHMDLRLPSLVFFKEEKICGCGLLGVGRINEVW